MDPPGMTRADHFAKFTHHDHPYLDETPSWSTDGWIYFQSNRTGDYAIYRMHADGSHQERLTQESP